MKWISRRRSHNMNGTYFEGSMKGCLWLSDIKNTQNKLLKIPNDFTDKIKEMHYCGDKNLLFVTCKDGRFKCWKLPTNWVNMKIEHIQDDKSFTQL